MVKMPPSSMDGGQAETRVGAEEAAGDVRDNQTDPADHAADRDEDGGGQDGGENQQPAFTTCGDAEREGGLFVERQQVEPPAVEVDDDEANEDDGQDAEEFSPRQACQSAEQPEGDFGQLGERVGEVFEQAQSRREKRRDGNARQHEAQNPSAVAQAMREQVGDVPSLPAQKARRWFG